MGQVGIWVEDSIKYKGGKVWAFRTLPSMISSPATLAFFGSPLKPWSLILFTSISTYYKIIS